MDFIELTVDDGIAVVKIDRPPVNAISLDLALELREAFEQCADPAIRAVVVTGEPHFVAGGDIKGFKATHDEGGEETTAWQLQLAIAALEALEKPTIAAIQGFALGGGLELALGCDFRYMADDARVGQPEILLGLIPGAGGTQRLPRVVGYQRAKEMIYSGRQVASAEALVIGLADKVTTSDELFDLAMTDARSWATKATKGIAAAKRALNEGAALPAAEGVEVERAMFKGVFDTEDAKEGVAAFVEKRPPAFQGK